MYILNVVYKWCRFKCQVICQKITYGMACIVSCVTLWVDEWHYLLLYYKFQITIRYHIYRRLEKLRKLFYTSGFVAKNRGLHWNKKY